MGAVAGESAKARPVIIDTDIGDDIDDAFALALALRSPRIKVIGVTTAWGDTSTRVLLARRLLSVARRREVPVARGPATTTQVPFTQQAWAMGAEDRSNAPDAIDFIAAEARRHPGEITLVSLAPMSNIRALQARYPDALSKLKQVVMMGGSIYVGYDKPSPSPEYNVASDPGALRDLLHANVPVIMFPLDSTRIQLGDAERAQLFAHRGALIGALDELYQQWRANNLRHQTTPVLFDVAPVAWLADPSLCAPQPMRIVVDDLAYTRPEPGPANVSVCLAMDEAAVRKHLTDRLAGYPSSATSPRPAARGAKARPDATR